MSVPTTRAEFKAYCLRRLGAPVIEINIADEQVEDRIDEALKYYADYHFDATEKMYYAHQVTQDDITNKYITLPQNIIGAVRIFDLTSSSSMSSSSLFDINYHIAMDVVFNIGTVEMAPYYIARQNLELIHQILNGAQPIRYSRHMNRLYVDTKWSGKLTVGEYLIVEAYQVIDPELFSDVWGDRWLARYACALIKKQWGDVLSKYIGVQLTGGVQFNGEAILASAERELEKLEQEMLVSYSLPVTDMIG
jgi:hypothetical protein